MSMLTPLPQMVVELQFEMHPVTKTMSARLEAVPRAVPSNAAATSVRPSWRAIILSGDFVFIDVSEARWPANCCWLIHITKVHDSAGTRQSASSIEGITYSCNRSGARLFSPQLRAEHG